MQHLNREVQYVITLCLDVDVNNRRKRRPTCMLCDLWFLCVPVRETHCLFFALSLSLSPPFVPTNVSNACSARKKILKKITRLPFRSSIRKRIKQHSFVHDTLFRCLTTGRERQQQRQRTKNFEQKQHCRREKKHRAPNERRWSVSSDVEIHACEHHALLAGRSELLLSVIGWSILFSASIPAKQISQRLSFTGHCKNQIVEYSSWTNENTAE